MSMSEKLVNKLSSKKLAAVLPLLWVLCEAEQYVLVTLLTCVYVAAQAAVDIVELLAKAREPKAPRSRGG